MCMTYQADKKYCEVCKSQSARVQVQFMHLGADCLKNLVERGAIVLLKNTTH